MRKSLRVVLAAAALIAATGTALADGGSLIVRKQTGSLVVSVFSGESPVRIGTSDLSVMVQKASDQSAVMDATVMLRLTTRTPAGDVTEVVAPATHAKATNKTLYAANVTLPFPGLWRLSAEVTSGAETAGVTADLNVLPQAPPVETYWPYFSVIPFAILLFLFNRWLRGRRELAGPRAQP
ncbi:MAG: hypothetical protein JOY54_03145 [Acidobacteriaceae bacterium]|nr:hypothetical protein [Acidobacteriaceae bacterium]